MKVNKRFKKLSLILFATLILMIASGFLFAMLKKEDDSVKITIAVPQSEFVQNFDTNYYTGWLREKTGYEIEFVTISDGYEEEYLQTMLYAKEGRIDMVFLPHQKSYMDKEVFVSFAKEGLLEDLAEYASLGTRMREILDEAEFIESLNNEFDGRIYFLPSVDAGKKHNNMQVLWINMGWLKKLSLKVPETTDDLEKVLTAFKDMDPNKNGIHDEIPLITNDTDSAYQSTYFLLDAFSYVNPDTDFMNNTSEIEAGLEHCEDLYQRGLISDICKNYSIKQVRELVNASDDLVGAFTSKSIEDIVYPNCEDVLARYVQVPPLKGPDGEQNAIRLETEVFIGGFIPANAKHKDEAFKVMDLMLSLEGSLIASFGEENTDWRVSTNGELSGYGTKAKITTLNYFRGKIQNKNYAGVGPMYLPKEYSDAVAWKGDNSFVEYLDARAIRTYENFWK